MKENSNALVVKSLSKTFKLPHERHSSLKQSIVNFHKKRTYSEFKVLNNISFSVKKGEFFGVVGRNGSGKSTLLKLIAGIYRPTTGSVEIEGSLTPFIELGVGFNMELSGRDNIYLNGAILGLDEKEIDEIYDEIVEFAELEQFMDQKLKNYSSGMMVRLAFSVAIRAHNDILLIDEVLAVGDANFQRKCFNIFKDIKKSCKTVIFVTHDMNAVQEFCDRALLINDGKVIVVGPPQNVSAKYNEINFNTDKSNKTKKPTSNRFGNGKIKILKTEIYVNGVKKKYITPYDKIELVFTIKSSIDTEFLFGFNIRNQEESIIYSVNSEEVDLNKTIIKANQEKKINILLEKNILGNGTYRVSAAVKNISRTDLYDQVNDVIKIEIAGWKNQQPIIHPDVKINIE